MERKLSAAQSKLLNQLARRSQRVPAGSRTADVLLRYGLVVYANDSEGAIGFPSPPSHVRLAISVAGREFLAGKRKLPRGDIGNPLGERGLSDRERRLWYEAAAHADRMKVLLDQFVDYLHGGAIDGSGLGPCAEPIAALSIRLLSAQEEAMGLRLARLNATEPA